MKTIQYTFWQDGEFFLGCLNEFPEYETQGLSKEELLENLKDLYFDIKSGEIPYIRKVEEMAIAE
jgi:predicted RNase H-like HicB family nuclease